MSEEKRGIHAPTILGGMGGALLGVLVFVGLGVGANFADGLSFSDVILFAVYVGFIAFGGFVAESLRPRDATGSRSDEPQKEPGGLHERVEAADPAENRVATIASRLWTTIAIVAALVVGGTGLFFLLITLSDDSPQKNERVILAVSLLLMLGGPLGVYGVYRWGYWLFRRRPRLRVSRRPACMGSVERFRDETAPSP